MGPSSRAALKRQVAGLLDELEEALGGGARGTAALEEALRHEPCLPAAPSPFSLGSGSPFALGSTQLSPSASLSFSFSSVLGAKRRREEEEAAEEAAGLSQQSMEQLEALLQQPEPPAGCRPHSRDDFNHRLASFRSARGWFDKPQAVGPLVCARYGWSLDTPDVLLCAVCSARIKCPLMMDEKEAVNALTAELREAHRPLCAWLGNASPESFTSLLLPSLPGLGIPPTLPEGPHHALDQLRKRVAALLRMPYLPMLAASLTEALDECSRAAGVEGGAAALLQVMAGRLGADNAAQSAVYRSPAAAPATAIERRYNVALCLALFGWRPAAMVTPFGAAEPQPTLECVEDARTLGLWHYQRMDAVGAAVTPDTTEPARPLPVGIWKRAHVDPNANAGSGAHALPCLDPIAEHRPWSPWITPTRGDTMPAWMRSILLMLPKANALASTSVARAASAALAML
eukprot:scaffold105629_cov26-Tisochrysis_lutea.AAC.1